MCANVLFNLKPKYVTVMEKQELLTLNKLELKIFWYSCFKVQ